MKKCIICKIDKELSDFYKHSKMKDGHLNKCISCCKNQSLDRHKVKSKDKEWVKSEQKRGREKYNRLNYNEKYPYKFNQSSLKWKEKFPEKRLAQQAAQHIECLNGYHRHHWSYKEEHQKDVIILSPIEHSFHHRFIIYDEERNMYRTIDGILLDSKESYIDYINTFPKEQ